MAFCSGKGLSRLILPVGLGQKSFGRLLWSRLDCLAHWRCPPCESHDYGLVGGSRRSKRHQLSNRPKLVGIVADKIVQATKLP